MLKKEELANPNSCMSRAHEDEMVFVLLARDPAAPGAIREWIKNRIALGKNKLGDEQIWNAEHCAREMEKQFRAANPYTVYHGKETKDR